MNCNDTDDDGVFNLDNCPNKSNSNQEDIGGDELGDVCDNCPNFSNPNQLDNDLDGIDYICDPFPNGNGPHIDLE